MQRKKKRSIIFELHSIPIKIRSLCARTRKNLISSLSPRISKRLYLVSYSIPLSCVAALLLGFGAMINPSNTIKTNAVEIGEAKVASSDAGVKLSREAPIPSVTFEIGGAGQNEIVETAVDTVAYRSHTVQVAINNAEDYYLMISGQPSLSLSDGTKSLSGISGSNVTGANIPAGQWGYSWDQTNTISDDSMIYKTVPSAQTRLNVPGLTDYATNFTGKLNFAAKFPDNATLGNYSSSVNLTLVVTPKANTGKAYWYDENGKETNYEVGTGTMQGVGEVDHGADGGFCKGNDKIGVGWATELVDNRDGKTYTVYKAADGNCWMGQNLTLSGPKLLTAADTDLAKGTSWALPADAASWQTGSTSAAYNTAQVKTGSSELSGWKEGYGNYYSWAAATAGSGTTTLSAYGVNVNSSICPRGWRLPITGSGGYSFNSLTNADTRSWGSNQTINGVSGVSGYYFGVSNNAAANQKVYKRANFWPAAYEYDGSLKLSSLQGNYWSRTAESYSNNSTNDIGKARLLTFSSASAHINYTWRWTGLPIRCVADASGIWQNNTGALGEEFTGLQTMQEVTKANFTNKYCSTSKNSEVSVGATIDLRDERDNNVYTIVKLKDGNCWMQQNLSLEATENAGLLLTPGDTNITSDWTLPETPTGTSGNLPSWTNTGTIPHSGTYAGSYTYYNWCAATAGTCADATTQYTNATGSICPKGWVLPTGGDANSQNQFYTLFGKNGAYIGATSDNDALSRVKQAPYLFPPAGRIYYGSSSSMANDSVYYWTNMAYSDTEAYDFASVYSGGGFHPGTDHTDRSHGYAVRCLAAPTT